MCYNKKTDKRGSNLKRISKLRDSAINDIMMIQSYTGLILQTHALHRKQNKTAYWRSQILLISLSFSDTAKTKQKNRKLLRC